MKVTIFHTGRVIVDQAIPLHESNPLGVTGLFRDKSKQMTLPVSCYLIEHPKGNVLIDTGWDSKYASQKPEYFLGMLNKVSKPVINKNEGIDAQLARLGIKDTDLNYVIYSHMDIDHTSGTRLVRNARHIMASKEEVEASRKPSFRYIKDTWSMVNVESFQFHHTGIGPVGESYDFYGDGIIQLIHTPGHTKGHTSVKVCGKDGSYLIIGGDAAYIPQSFSNEIIPGFTTSKQLARQSLQWLISCKQDPQCTGVYVNHDPSIQPQTIEVTI